MIVTVTSSATRIRICVFVGSFDARCGRALCLDPDVGMATAVSSNAPVLSATIPNGELHAGAIAVAG